MFYLFLLPALIFSTISWSFFNVDQESDFSLFSRNWQKQFTKDLAYHKQNAMLLRSDVIRENPHFTSQDALRLCNINFKKFASKKQYTKENISPFLRGTQAIAEDQNSFYEAFQEKVFNLNKLRHCQLTLNLIMKFVGFSKLYNARLANLYKFLQETYSNDICLNEVPESFHHKTCKRLSQFPQKGSFLIFLCKNKLEKLHMRDIPQNVIFPPKDSQKDDGTLIKARSAEALYSGDSEKRERKVFIRKLNSADFKSASFNDLG